MPYRNRLLRSLTAEQRQLLYPHLTPVNVAAGEYLYRYDEPVRAFIFLVEGVVSVIRPLADGTPVEIFTYGGGLGLLVGGHTLFQVPLSLYDYLVRRDITGWRISREALEAAMAQDPALRDLFQQTIHAMDAAVVQNVACRTVHSHEQRLARTLLTLRETLGDHIVLPRHVIAMMVPCPRTAIHRVAQPLIAAGIIQFGRNRRQQHVDILDPDRLHLHACECFGALIALRDGLFKKA